LAQLLNLYSKKNKNENKENLLYIFYSCLFAIIINYIIKFFIFSPRPIDYLDNTNFLLLDKIPESSFPSDHASISIAFLTSLYIF